jgi:hypothetical protein
MATNKRAVIHRHDAGQTIWKQDVAPLVSVSSGAPDAGSIPLLREDGKIDNSMLPDTGPIDSKEVVYNQVYPTVYDALDALLYVHPQITSFTNNVGVREVGSTVSSVTLNWTYNKTEMTTQSLTGSGAPSPLDIALRTCTITGAFTNNTSWTLSAGDGKNTVSSSTSISFQYKRYWGVSTKTSLTTSDILGFSSEFATGNGPTYYYDCTGGKYPYYCYPASWGSLTKVQVGGLSFSAFTTVSQTFVNASGHSDTYNVVRFDGVQFGNNLKVVWA